MIPFGRCILLWRLHRGLSQAALAQKTGIPQPNLSDIERGKRDVSLRTLRTLAQALEVTPGVLADGIGPGPVWGSMDLAPGPGTPKAAPRRAPVPLEQERPRLTSRLVGSRQDGRDNMPFVASGQGAGPTPAQALSRDQMERIAQSAVDGSRLADLNEDRLAHSLRAVTRDRRAALLGSGVGQRKGPGRKSAREWLALSGGIPSAQLDSLIERVGEKALPRNHTHPVLPPSREKGTVMKKGDAHES